METLSLPVHRVSQVRYVLILLAVSASLHAQTNVQRPHILGLAHVAFRVSKLSRTSAFYQNLLGFVEPFSLPNGIGQDALAVVKVNDEQYIELLQGDARSQGQLDHFALYTDDLAAMREYLLGQRVPLLKDVHQGRVGNPFLTIRDPDGHPLEIVQYSSISLTGQSRGKFMPADRVSNHITHIGIVVRSAGTAMKFYRDVLGFREISRGGGDSGHPGWIDLQTPDGSDYIELLPFSGVPSPSDLKAQNHLGLASPDVRKTVAGLQNRATGASSSSAITVKTGGGLPPRADILDPDGARIEIMESVSAGTPVTPAPHPDR
jgi:catechol 2,3-dioxygenase-like lactoylglutathione lyase family enzyme